MINAPTPPKTWVGSVCTWCDTLDGLLHGGIYLQENFTVKQGREGQIAPEKTYLGEENRGHNNQMSLVFFKQKVGAVGPARLHFFNYEMFKEREIEGWKRGLLDGNVHLK